MSLECSRSKSLIVVARRRFNKARQVYSPQLVLANSNVFTVVFTETLINRLLRSDTKFTAEVACFRKN